MILLWERLLPSHVQAARFRCYARSLQLGCHRCGGGGRCAHTSTPCRRGADIHAIHGAGLGSSSGYAPQDFQAIDLALWGGPRRVRPPQWRVAWNCLKWWLKGKPQRAAPNNVEMVRLLLDRGAADDLPIAAALGDTKRIVEILEKDPPRIRETRSNGRLALSAAVEFGHNSIVLLLLERGADPTWPDADGSSRGAALHMLRMLLKSGMSPDYPTWRMKSFLHCLCEGNRGIRFSETACPP